MLIYNLIQTFKQDVEKNIDQSKYNRNYPRNNSKRININKQKKIILIKRPIHFWLRDTLP